MTLSAASILLILVDVSWFSLYLSHEEYCWIFIVKLFFRLPLFLLNKMYNDWTHSCISTSNRGFSILDTSFFFKVYIDNSCTYSGALFIVAMKENQPSAHHQMNRERKYTYMQTNIIQPLNLTKSSQMIGTGG